MHGAGAWLVWIALALILAESVTALLLLSYQLLAAWRARRLASPGAAPAQEPLGADHPDQVPRHVWLGGLLVSSAVCAVVCVVLFDLPWYEPYVAVSVSLLVSLLAVRALGMTDLNPVGGVSKLSQLVFAAVAPGRLVANIVAGGIAEAGAQQAGDMMQDLRTGMLLGISPRVQFYAQLLGSAFSCVFALAAWLLFTSAYTVPGPDLEAPSARLWVNMAQLLSDGRLPPHLLPFCVTAGLVAASLPLLGFWRPSVRPALPSAVAFGIGMYLSPYWTVPRFLGALAEVAWRRFWPATHRRYMIVVASGLVLGEGLLAILVAVLTSAHVPLWTCAGCVPALCPSRCFSS